MELRSPIRLFWDITPLPAPLPDYRRIAERIAASKVLTVQITDLSVPLSPFISEAVRSLSGARIAVTLTVARAALPEAHPLLDSGLSKLHVDIHSPDTVKSIDLQGVGVSFTPAPDTVEMLPDMVRACLDHGIRELTLPMERLISGGEPLCLTRSQQELLSSRLAAIPFGGTLSLTIHDPFLWRAFYPDTPFPDGSCQACNTMLAVSPSGDVHPCPAMPCILGNLCETDFRDIVSSQAKRETRAHINAVPPFCRACSLFPGCRGGCRGRGRYLKGNWDAPDPACGFSE